MKLSKCSRMAWTGLFHGYTGYAKYIEQRETVKFDAFLWIIKRKDKMMNMKFLEEKNASNSCMGLFHRMIWVLAIFIMVILVSCSGDINSNNDPHFTEDGYRIIGDSTITLTPLTQVKFFVEVSGSMNGFFRANQPTDFKKDVWQILNYFSPIAPGVTILTNNGDEGNTYDFSKFQTMMNTGAFVSSASTKVPLMLQTIVSNLDADHGEVAVLISDMKYSPVGAAAPKVLMTQYSTDISKIFGQYGKAISLVCATSNYLDKKGNYGREYKKYN